jgi:transposase
VGHQARLGWVGTTERARPACPSRARCTRSTTTGRKLTLRPRPKHEALVAARQRQETAAFKAEDARRAGIEGTLAQGTRRFGLRHARYRGLPKTHLQHVLTAICVNLVRLVAWHGDPTHRQVQPSRFVALATAA